MFLGGILPFEFKKKLEVIQTQLEYVRFIYFFLQSVAFN